MIDRPIPGIEDSPREARAFIEESRRRLLEIADRCRDLGLSADECRKVAAMGARIAAQLNQ
ncbi:hypothetical protein [Amaricoccus sp.]|uniref:hypothetical protein n=1 Tax=Amaricoccus sp. TaxID=1872485 RepID=UPI001B3F873B|nr:hypothetical protein [Amaricoccus sp.]MBP7001686.1 hypothetical protein [Amaricoccus sp.]